MKAQDIVVRELIHNSCILLSDAQNESSKFFSIPEVSFKKVMQDSVNHSGKQA